MFRSTKTLIRVAVETGEEFPARIHENRRAAF
jgi:hypothetical protein